MEQFVLDLRAEGWRVHAARLTGRVSCPELLCEALGSVTTEYVVRMDGDTVSHQDPGRAVAAARTAGADLCSVKITVSRRQSLIEKLQAVEYDMSMLGRHNRAWMTSGACMIARTSALRGILASHSFWFPGEDLETGVIAKHFRLSVRHLDMRFTPTRRRRFALAPAAPDVVGRQLPDGFRQRRPDNSLSSHVRLHRLVVWLLWVAKWNELAIRGTWWRSCRSSWSCTRASASSPTGPCEAAGSPLPVLRALPGSGASSTRSALLREKLVRQPHAETTGPLSDRVSA